MSDKIHAMCGASATQYGGVQKSAMINGDFLPTANSIPYDFY